MMFTKRNDEERVRLAGARRLVPLVLAVLALAGCGGGDDAPEPRAAAAQSWEQIAREARGQRVDWWMYGGDERVNAYVDEHVIPAARERGVTLRRVPITDTADAVARVVAQRRAGRTDGGAVDLVWINGENFASGKEAWLWLTDWAGGLPNARHLDPDDPTLVTDFGEAVDGQESPWSRAAFVYAADSAAVPEPPADLDALLDWARANPGRFTYPAPPDFTGSAFVRQVVAAKGEDAAFAYLRELEPFMYREGTALPKSEAELNELFAAGQVDIAMSYDASFVASGVRKGQFPRSTRPFVLDSGTLGNVSFVTIPADAADREGAQVVADLLLDPELQALKADPEILGHPTVLDTSGLSASERERFDRLGGSRHLLDDLGDPVEELAAERVGELERRWIREVLRGVSARTLLPVAPAAVVTAVLFGGALAGAARTSLITLDGSATLAAWEDLFADPVFFDSLRFTAQLALLTTAISALLALALATALRGRGALLRAIVALPVPVPHLIAATAAVVWLGPGGLAERIAGELPFQLIRDEAGLGVVAVYVYKEVPFLVLLLLAAAGPDLHDRDEAARVLGLGWWQRLRWVIWPALRGPLVVGSIIVAAYVIGSFEVPLAVGPNSPPTLSAYALEATQGDLIAGQARAAAALLVATVAALALALVAIRFARDVEGR